MENSKGPGLYNGIRKLFISETTEKISLMRELLTASKGKITGELAGSFYLMFHSLKGTGQTIGFGNISDLAGEALDYLESLQGGKAPDHPRQVIFTLKSLVLRLESLIPQAGDTGESSAAAPCRAGTGKVLVVDDDGTILMAIRERLRMEGVEAVTTKSGAEAIKIIEESPDIEALVIDIVMPGMDGINLCRRIRESPFGMELPIIFLTAQDSLNSKISGFEVGADDYIAKPFDLDELAIRVKTLIRRQNYFRGLSIKDHLTGAFNRRYLSQRVTEEIARCDRTGCRFSIFILDIDRFKVINDTLGHQAGDSVLADLTDFLRRGLRKTDVVSRLGGDEFTILLPDTPLDLAAPIIDRLKKGFAGRESTGVGERLSVTFSAGGAEYPVHGKTEGELMAQADREMYRDKKMGKGPLAEGLSDQCPAVQAPE